MIEPRMKLTYQGTDSWGRAVFKSEDGKIYKSPDYLVPEGGFFNASKEKQDKIWNNLHNSVPCRDFEGEPGWPINISKFELVSA